MDLNDGLLGIGARIKHPTFGEGIIVGMDLSTLNVFFKHEGDKEISRKFDGLKVLESAQEADTGLDLKTVEAALKRVLKEMAGISQPVAMGGKWEGGTLIIKPATADLQSKEVPIDAFFHKIVMVRDRLRVLEQNINSHEKLNDADKVHMQQYISRIYGSLTTFNILFADKEDHFSSK
ncbi:hypothetical protein G3O08_06665 [Cryomorpha ignava]|uniref:Uncharacterized protein n=1 Tax=Cryomorpha ignava TaxID=101383 RepID=A0A7K3WNF4_9FLAO|nr:hypothetical protein [Cryomorpha ignava]NEN23180.1 hypothetical protein [Cryomorpha ignava]